MLLAMSEDVRVIIIKLADRLHNVRTLNFVAPQKRGFVSKHARSAEERKADNDAKIKKILEDNPIKRRKSFYACFLILNMIL